MTDQPRIEYIEARRVLLDALTALQPHIEAVVLIGAQAVYLRTAGRRSRVTHAPSTPSLNSASGAVNGSGALMHHLNRWKGSNNAETPKATVHQPVGVRTRR